MTAQERRAIELLRKAVRGDPGWLALAAQFLAEIDAPPTMEQINARLRNQ